MSNLYTIEAPRAVATKVVVHRQFEVFGLICAGEAAGLERRLLRQAGVIEAMVNPDTMRAYVTHDPGRVDTSTLITIIQDSGYGVG